MTRSQSSGENPRGTMPQDAGWKLRCGVAVVAATLGASGCGFSTMPAESTEAEEWVAENVAPGTVVSSGAPVSADIKAVDDWSSPDGQAVVDAKREIDGLVPPGPTESMVVIKTEAVERSATPAQELGSPPEPPAPPPPVLPGTAVLSLDREALEFGSTESERVLTIANHGGGILAYTLETDASWVTLATNGGEVSTDVNAIVVTVDRAPLYVGHYTATVTVRGDEGSMHVLPVTMDKPNTFPVTVPWLEMGLATPDDLQVARDGLVHWRRVTDTVCLLAGPNESHTYTTLRTEFPGMTIIPSIKSSPRTTPRSLDSIEAWQLLAADIAVVCAATGVNQVVLENETATWNYLHGTETIDLEQFRQALSYLPASVQVIWYPGVSVCADAELVARSVALCQVVEDVLHPRFVDLSFGDPDWPVYPPSGYAREAMDNMAQQPTMPIVYLGYQDWPYWPYADAPVVLGQIDPRPSCLFYPGRTQWFAAAQAVAQRIWPVTVQQQDGGSGDDPGLKTDEDGRGG